MISLFGGNQNIELQWWTFPGGERNVKIVDPDCIARFHSFTVCCDYRGSDDLIDILLLVNAARNVDRNVRLRLFMPYFPFARQDRVMTPGEPFALQVAVNLIKSCNFNEIEVWDPHSDVLAGMFEPGTLKIVPQEKLVFIDYEQPNVCLVSPDGGALKKIYKVSEKHGGLPVVCAQKIRDVNTGNIVGVWVPEDIGNFDTVIIVDDICDGGKSFIELAKAIREIKPLMNIQLSVTHGIFSKGLEPLREVIDWVYATNWFDGRENESV